MTPAARVQAAIEVLDRILAGAPAEQALIGWARSSRYAGSGDRAAVRDHVFDALRRRRSCVARSGLPESGRALMIGALRDDLRETIFTGATHAPAELNAGEKAALAAIPAALPDPVRLNYPDWLDGALRTALGDDLGPVMAAQADRAPVFLRANPQRGTESALMAALDADGISIRRRDEVLGAFEVLSGSNKIKQSRAYLEGLVELQDLTSQAAVAALPVTDGMEILDYCAGGGGKSLALAARVTGHITAHDVAYERMADLPVRAARAGVRIRLARPTDLRRATQDLVLVDAPCSGSGTWRRTPDAKWRLTAGKLADLCALQARILEEALVFARPGGLLAYMTCSLLREENEDQLAALLARHPGIRLLDQRRFSPLTGGDGFFLGVMRVS